MAELANDDVRDAVRETQEVVGGVAGGLVDVAGRSIRPREQIAGDQLTVDVLRGLGVARDERHQPPTVCGISAAREARAIQHRSHS